MDFTTTNEELKKLANKNMLEQKNNLQIRNHLQQEKRLNYIQLQSQQKKDNKLKIKSEYQINILKLQEEENKQTDNSSSKIDPQIKHRNRSLANEQFKATYKNDESQINNQLRKKSKNNKAITYHINEKERQQNLLNSSTNTRVMTNHSNKSDQNEPNLNKDIQKIKTQDQNDDQQCQKLDYLNDELVAQMKSCTNLKNSQINLLSSEKDRFLLKNNLQEPIKNINNDNQGEQDKQNERLKMVLPNQINKIINKILSKYTKGQIKTPINQSKNKQKPVFFDQVSKNQIQKKPDEINKEPKTNIQSCNNFQFEEENVFNNEQKHQEYEQEGQILKLNNLTKPIFENNNEIALITRSRRVHYTQLSLPNLQRNNYFENKRVHTGQSISKTQLQTQFNEQKIDKNELLLEIKQIEFNKNLEAYNSTRTSRSISRKQESKSSIRSSFIQSQKEITIKRQKQRTLSQNNLLFVQNLHTNQTFLDQSNNPQDFQILSNRSDQSRYKLPEYYQVKESLISKYQSKNQNIFSEYYSKKDLSRVKQQKIITERQQNLDQIATNNEQKDKASISNIDTQLLQTQKSNQSNLDSQLPSPSSIQILQKDYQQFEELDFSNQQTLKKKKKLLKNKKKKPLDDIILVKPDLKYKYLQNQIIEQKNNFKDQSPKQFQCEENKDEIGIQNNLIMKYQFQEFDKTVKNRFKNKLKTISFEKSLQNLSSFLNINHNHNINAFHEFDEGLRSQHFQEESQLIIQKLKEQHFVLDKLIQIKQYEDTFYGYQLINRNKTKYIFKIKYQVHKFEPFVLNQKLIAQTSFNNQNNSERNQNNQISGIIKNIWPWQELQQEIQVLDQIKDIKYQHVQISEKTSILSFKQEYCTLVEQAFYLKDQVRAWNRTYFKHINSQQKLYTEKCGLFDKFLQNEAFILKTLEEKKYFLTKFLYSGTSSILFEGYIEKQIGVYEDISIKMLFDQSPEDIKQEFQIMKLFGSNFNIIQYYDMIQLNEQISVLTLERCQYNLSQELNLIKNNSLEFSISKLTQIISNLLDGLIQLRFFNIVHPGIQPDSILQTQNGVYIYSDFEMSSIKMANNLINIKRYKDQNEILEQNNFDSNTDFKIDILSLANLIKGIIKQFREFNKNNQKIDEYVQILERLVEKQMILIQTNQKENIQSLHLLLFYLIIEKIDEQFFLEYFQKIELINQQINSLSDQGLPHFQNLNLYYQKFVLKIFESEKVRLIAYFGEEKFQILKSNYLKQISQCYEQLNDQENALKFSLESLSISQQINNTNQIQLGSTLYLVAQCYKNKNDYLNALHYAQESLNLFLKIFKGNNQFIAQSLYLVAQCYSDKNDFKSTLKFSLESLKIFRSIYETNHKSIAKSLYLVAWSYQNKSQIDKALQYSLESLQIYRQVLKGNYSSLSSCLYLVAQCYSEKSDYENALKYSLESLETDRQIYQGNHSSIASSLHLVAQCYMLKSDCEKALQFSLESLEMYRQILKENHPSIASCIYLVAQCYSDKNEYENALKFSLESLEMFKKIYKVNHSSIASSLHLVAQCYKDKFDFENALKFSKQSLEMERFIFQGNHSSIASSLYLISQCYKNQKDYENALIYSLESLEMNRLYFKENHSSISSSLYLVAEIYYDKKDYEKALQYSLESLEVEKNIFKGNHLSIASTLYLVSLCYQNKKDTEKALNYSLQSIEMMNKIFTENHPTLASCLYLVAQCYFDKSDYENALKFSLKSLEMNRQIYESNHLSIAQSLFLVSQCYKNKNDHENAIKFSLESVELNRLIFHDNHLSIASSLSLVAQCYKNKKDYENALKYSFESLEMKRSILSENHQLIAQRLQFIAQCYILKNDNENALKFSMESLEMNRQLFKGNHSSIAQSLQVVAQCYKNKNDFYDALTFSFESLQMYRQILKGNHPQIQQSLQVIAQCYFNKKDYEHALNYSLESLQMSQQLFKSYHSSIASSLYLVGQCYMMKYSYESALKFSLQSLDMRRQIYKGNHSSISSSLFLVAQCFMLKKDYKNALRYSQESLDIGQKVFAKDHYYLQEFITLRDDIIKNINHKK